MDGDHLFRREKTVPLALYGDSLSFTVHGTVYGRCHLWCVRHSDWQKGGRCSFSGSGWTEGCETSFSGTCEAAVATCMLVGTGKSSWLYTASDAWSVATYYSEHVLWWCAGVFIVSEYAIVVLFCEFKEMTIMFVFPLNYTYWMKLSFWSRNHIQEVHNQLKLPHKYAKFLPLMNPLCFSTPNNISWWLSRFISFHDSVPRLVPKYGVSHSWLILGFCADLRWNQRSQLRVLLLALQL